MQKKTHEFILALLKGRNQPVKASTALVEVGSHQRVCTLSTILLATPGPLIPWSIARQVGAIIASLLLALIASAFTFSLAHHFNLLGERRQERLAGQSTQPTQSILQVYLRANTLHKVAYMPLKLPQS